MRTYEDVDKTVCENRKYSHKSELTRNGSLSSLNKPSKLFVSGLPSNVSVDFLILFFENENRQGGGPVQNVEIDEEAHRAIVEFVEAESVEKVLHKRPILIQGIEVKLSLFDGYTSITKQVSGQPNNRAGDASGNIVAEFGIEMRVTPLVPESTTDENVHGEDAYHADRKSVTDRVSFFNNVVEKLTSKKPLIQRKHSEKKAEEKDGYTPITKQVSGQPNDGAGDASGNIVAEFGIEKQVKSKKPPVPVKKPKRPMHASAFHPEQTDNVLEIQNIDQTAAVTKENTILHPLQKSDIKTTNDVEAERHKDMTCENMEQETTTEPSTEKATFDRILKGLGLEDKYPGKITITDVTTIDLLDRQTHDPGEVKSSDIPQRFLKQLMTSNSNARDLMVTPSKEDDTDSETDETDHSAPDDITDSNNISPLDILVVVFQCCDPMLQQMICQKMYLCKLAVPFSYVSWEGNYPRFEIPIWPLRSLTIGCSIYNADTPVLNNEFDILSLPTQVIAFSRFGRPNYSKSALLNKLLSEQGHSTFFHKDCPSGATQRIVSNGYIEQFWLPTIDESKDNFKDALTFLNIRGAIQELDADRLNFLSSFIDVMVIVIDQNSIAAVRSEVENMLLKFRTAVLIIANPLQQSDKELLKEMQKSIKSENKEFKFISTYKKGTTERNVVDMVLAISEIIRKENEQNTSKPLEERLNKAPNHMFTIDENDPTCQLGKKEAEIIISAMKEDGEARVWKKTVTPVQYTSAPKLGVLIKQQHRSQDLTETNKIECKIEQMRKTQTQMVSNSLRMILNALTSKIKTKAEIAYFLGWLHYFIEKEKRAVLPELVEKRKNAWKQLQCMEENESSSKKSIEEQKEIISKIKTEINEASFSVEHINREIGHIYDAAFKTNTDYRAIGLPPLLDVVEVYASLVANGQPFEIIDGDSSYMPYEWLKNILARVNQLLGKNAILALSVLGVQSSGKSTLLNTMFGSKFSTKTGRCTKGIHMQLVPVNKIPKQTYQNNFDYILIVDTEGLRSPELGSLDYEHDNELATVITGIGDMTLLNIMGENTSEIKDILQIVVHAFLRLKLSNKTLDLQKSCIFIHQNVTEPSASEHMSEGLNKLVSDLNKMTDISAHIEGIEGISKFNQVIAFDQNSQVWYINNLWQGNPPMARVNVGYSSKVVQLRSKVIDHALQMKDKSFKSLTDILTNANDLWKGVLNENFLFSFRNSIEVKANMDMETKVQKNVVRFELDVLMKVSKVTRSMFAACTKLDDLANKEKAVSVELHSFLDKTKSEIESNVEKFFEENEYKQIIKQWKQGQLNKIEATNTRLDNIITVEVHKEKDRREQELFAESGIKKHEAVLYTESMNIVNKYRGKQLSNTEINILFEDVWKPFEDEVKNSSKRSREVKCIRDTIIECLHSIFKRERGVLNQSLHAKKDLKCPYAKPISLKGSFKETGVDETDLSYSLVKKGKELVKSQNSMPNIITRLDQVFEEIERQMTFPVDVELTQIHVNAVLHHLGQKLKEIEQDTKGINFKSTFTVKLYVHVSCYVNNEFTKHNQKHSQTCGIDAKLKKIKEQQKISFEARINNRRNEDTMADLFCNVLETFIRDTTFKVLPIEATDELFRILPVSKKRLIIRICIDLIDDNEFDNFIKYINDPNVYANKWLLQKCKEHLFGSSQKLFILAKEIASKNFRQIKDCFIECATNSQNTLKLFDNFLLQLEKKNLSIPPDDLKDVRIFAAKIAGSSFKDVVKLVESNMDEVVTKLNTELRSDCVANIKWRGLNPYNKVEKVLWGCTEKCAFCGEPCEGTKDHSGKHRSVQHRPPCCQGVYEGSTCLARLESCNVNVKSEDRAHGCEVFSYRCNPGKYKDCSQKRHLYCKYDQHLTSWDIQPCSSMTECSKFWLYFIAKYETKLRDLHGYKTSNIPSYWKAISAQEAKESLNQCYG